MPDTKQVFHIKNMVCPRCLTVVEETLADLGFEVLDVELGKAEVKNEGDLSADEVDEALSEHGFELLKGKREQTVEQVKALLIEYVKQSEEQDDMPKLSEYLTENMHQNYASLSSLFSEHEEITIEKYLIRLRIERVKELLSYDEFTLSEIAWKLNYSSVQHLSSQFKKVTGMSVTDFKKASDSFRKTLDKID